MDSKSMNIIEACVVDENLEELIGPKICSVMSVTLCNAL